MCPTSSPDSGPVPAIIVFSLTEQAIADREASAMSLFGIWSTLQMEGLVNHRPVELWRRRGVEDRLELHVLFRSRRVAASWLQHPAVRERNGDAVDTLLTEAPETHLYHDTLFDEWECSFCQCLAPSGLLVGRSMFERGFSIACLDCGGQFAEPDLEEGSVESWAKSYAHVYSLWIESEVLERWSAQQISDPASELNESGRGLCAALEDHLGVPVYLLIVRWDPDSREVLTSEECPACFVAGVPIEILNEPRICPSCRLAFE